MTPEKAIIILDRLNTTERIEVDRDELKEAVKTAKAAAQKQIAQKPVEAMHDINDIKIWCPKCNANVVKGESYCSQCGQALDWSEE